VPPGFATKELSSQSPRPFRHSPFSSFSPLLGNLISSSRLAHAPVGVAVFEDVGEMLDAYVRRLERLNGVILKCRATVDNADEAIRIFRRSRPSIVITDLSLGEEANTDGFTILRFIKKESPRTAVALATLHSAGSTTDIEAEIRKQPFDAVFHKTDFNGIESFIALKAWELRRAPIECIVGR